MTVKNEIENKRYLKVDVTKKFWNWNCDYEMNYFEFRQKTEEEKRWVEWLHRKNTVYILRMKMHTRNCHRCYTFMTSNFYKIIKNVQQSLNGSLKLYSDIRK